MFIYSYKTALELVKLLGSVLFMVTESPYVLTQNGAHTDPSKGNFEYEFSINSNDSSMIKSTYEGEDKISHWKEVYAGGFEISEENARVIYNSTVDNAETRDRLLFIDEDFGLLSESDDVIKENNEIVDAPDQLVKEDLAKEDIAKNIPSDIKAENITADARKPMPYSANITLSPGDILLIEHTVQSVDGTVILCEDTFQIKTNNETAIVGFTQGEEGKLKTEIEDKQKTLVSLLTINMIEYDTVVEYVKRHQSTESTISNS